MVREYASETRCGEKLGTGTPNDRLIVLRRIRLSDQVTHLSHHFDDFLTQLGP
ncbi:hypothetical protein Sjap_015842 [Stephania japonica]|uniref:Uncharacterized protein n=1 Tax=Stephania japonica TaxID=461633 RepID=A0AAP0IKP5_9MAGN